MSCGIVVEDQVRSIQVSEIVPWKNLSQVQKGMMRHDDKIYHVIYYHPEGKDSPNRQVHSVWRTDSALESFVKLNPGSEQKEKAGS